MSEQESKIVVHLEDSIGTINPNIYGHFAEHLGRCIYEGIWVGDNSAIPNTKGIRNDTIDAMKKLSPPVIRWPGGCFADDYHWEDGIGPRETRPRRINIWWHQEESNEFGTDDFIRFCRLVGAEPYICLNVGSGSPQEAKNWLEYCNYSGNTYYTQLRSKNGNSGSFKVKYWGVGNENWGCGGAFDPVDYAKEYRRFANYLKPVDPTIELIACGHTSPDWNLKFMETLTHFGLMDHLSIHRYYGYGNDVEFTDEEYYGVIDRSLQVDEDIRRTKDVLSFFTTGQKQVGIIVDEWGVWHPQARGDKGLEQKNTLRDAIVAAGVFDVFNKWASRVVMTNIAQTINVLQCVIQTDGEKLWLTPTYHVFNMYKPHMGSQSLRTEINCETINVTTGGKPTDIQSLSASASLNPDRKELALSVVNRHLQEDIECTINIKGDATVGEGKLSLLSADSVKAYNSAEDPDKVSPKSLDLVPKGKSFTHLFPAHSVTTIVLPVK